jgi:serine O-acetyltransferase
MHTHERTERRLARLGGQIRSWLRVRPGPASDPERSRPRVEVTPPSDPPLRWTELAESLSEDISAVLENDPAARHALEVVLVYPGLHAIWMHRIAHRWWKDGRVLAPRLLAHMNRMVTGIEIHPGARLGRRVFIDHGMGIVIGETATVGDDCLLYKGVVLGGTSLERAERHPTLGKGVVVGTNACILGPIQVGDGAQVGSNSVVIRDIPAATSVVGVPGKIIQERRRTQQALDHGNLPDPVANVLQAMIEELEHLRLRIADLEGQPHRRRAGRDHETGRFEPAEPTEGPAGEA